MKTKKYFKLILKPYNVILKHFDSDIRISIGQKFCCYPQLEEKEIEIPIFENKLGRENFYNKMVKRQKQYGVQGTYSSEILSFLHEIGHIYTYRRRNEITYNIGVMLIQYIQAKIPYDEFKPFFYNLYFNLKLERLADKWCMEFIKNNQELVEDWQNMLQNNYDKVLPKFIDHMKTRYNKDLLANE